MTMENPDEVYGRFFGINYNKVDNTYLFSRGCDTGSIEEISCSTFPKLLSVLVNRLESNLKTDCFDDQEIEPQEVSFEQNARKKLKKQEIGAIEKIVNTYNKYEQARRVIQDIRGKTENYKNNKNI